MVSTPVLTTKALGGAYTAVRDTLGDPTQLSAGEQLGYFRVLAALGVPNLRYPLGAVRTIKAIIESGDYAPMLHTMRDEGMPTMVVHADNDLSRAPMRFVNCWTANCARCSATRPTRWASRTWMTTRRGGARTPRSRCVGVGFIHGRDRVEIGPEELDHVELELVTPYGALGGADVVGSTNVSQVGGQAPATSAIDDPAEDAD